ncbi:MAG TPA: hypothetical protein VLS47_02620 [Gallionella sp.]|nr:hypothetical protein [Gallionella sp.]
MRKTALAALVSLGMLSLNALAENDAYNGFSVGYVRSTQNSVHNSTSVFSIMRSVRLREHYGYEMQFGLFGKSGPYTSGGFVDLSAIGLLPLGDKGLKLYGRAGLVDVYVQGPLGSANNLGLTYGAGFEYPRENGLVRVGLQHFNVGNSTLSPSLSANLFSLTLLLQ